MKTFQESAGETGSSLLATAAAHGFKVSKRQLARLCHAGFLSHPIRRGLGQGLGTVWYYLAGTSDRLLAICEIKKHERRFPYIAWHLWWAGHDGLTEQVREFLAWWARAYEHLSQHLVGDGGLTETGQRVVDRFATGRVPNGFRPIQHRVGRDRMSMFMGEVLKILSGKFGGWDDYDPNRDVITEGLGIARSGPGSDRWRWVRDSAAQKEMGQFLNPGAFREVLRRASNENLVQARNEFFNEVLPAIEGLGLNVINTDAIRVREQVAMFLVWLVFRRTF